MSHPSKRESLLTQLENMHKQFSDETTRKLNENGNPVEPASSRRNQPLISSVLGRNERTNSMPMFAGSSSHNGLLTSNNNQDMSFVMGLSENLLVECRRLQADNEKKARKYKAVRQTYDELKESNQKLESTHQLAAKELQSLRDLNWGLEEKLQNLSTEFRTQKEKLSRNKRDLKQESESTKKLKADLEVANLQHVNLENQLEGSKKQLAADVADLKRHVSDLNDENDALHSENHQLKSQINEYKELDVKNSSQHNELQKEIELARHTIRKLKRQRVRDVTKDQEHSGGESSNRRANSEEQENGNSDGESNDCLDNMEADAEVDYMDDEILLADVQDYAKRHNMVLLSEELYESIRPAVLESSASKESNNEKVKKSQPDSATSDQKDQHQSKIDLLKSCGYEIFSTADYKKMQDTLHAHDYPSQGYLESKLHELGKRAITLDNYESLTNPKHSQIVEKLERDKFKVLCVADYQKLHNSLEHPTLEELNGKLQIHNHVAISQEDYRNYSKPNLPSIEANAKSLGYTVMKDKLYNQMQTALQNPSTQIIKTSIEENDSVANELLTWILENRDAILLDKSRFEQLEACYEDPTREFLQEKAALQGSELIKSSEYAEIKHKLSNPSYEYLENKANAIQCQVLSSKKLAHLVNTSENPTLDFLARKAENKGYRVILIEEYQQLTSMKQNPDVEFLSAKAKEKNYQLIEEETYRSLTKNKSDPDLAFLKEKGGLKGYELVEKSHFEQMLAKLSNPGKKELESMAKTLGYVSIPISEFERMKGIIEHPSMEFLSNQAKKINLLLIGEDEKKHLEETGKDKASVFSAVKAFGFVPVPLPDLNLLKKSTIDNVGLPEITTRLCSLGYIAMPADQTDKPIVERASRDDTIALCSKYNLKPIPLAEYEQLRSNDKIKPHSKEECVTLLKSLNYVVLPEKRYKELTSQLESPGLNFLKERCSDLNHTVTPSDEYQKILRNVEKPSLNYLREKAVISGFSLVHTKRLEELQSTFDSPPIEFIEQKAKLHGRSIITLEEKNLKDKLEHPTLSYLSTKATEVGKCLVDQKFFDDLERKVATPTRKELEVSCDVLGLTLVPNDEYSRLNEEANSPALSNLKSNLDKMGYYCLPRNEYDTLQEHYNCPTEQYLAEKSHSLGKVLVDQVTYGEQRCQIENPSREYLVEHAANIHMKVVNAADYDKISELANSPSREHLEEKAGILGLLVVGQKEFKSVKDEAENPAFSKMEKSLQALGFALIESSKYRTLVEEAESPSVEKISLLAAKHDHILVHCKNVIQEESNVTDLDSTVKSGSYVLLKKDAYDSLISASMNKMSKREVIDMCANLDMIALPREKYDHLSQTPDLEAIQALAAQHASLVVLREHYDLLNAEADCPSTEAMDKSAEQKGLIIVQKAEYASLLSKVNNPSKRDLERQAEKLDLVAVPSGKYKSLLKEVQNKSASATPSPSSKVLASKQYFEQVIRDQAENPDKSYEPTKTLGFVKLSSEEYKTLKDNQQAHVLTKADIYNGAKVFSLAVLPLEEYKELLKKKANCNSLNYENLEDYAAKFDLKLVPLGLCTLDSPTPRRRKSIGSNRGDFLGFDDQSSHVTMRSCSTGQTDYIDANSNSDSSRLLQRQLTVSTTNSSNFTDALDDNMEESNSDAGSVASTVRAGSANEKDSLEDIRTKANALGYRLIALARSEHFEQQKTPEIQTATNDYRNESENGESVMSEEKLRCQAEKIGLIVMQNSEFEKVKNLQLTRENVEARGAELNLVILEKRDYDELIGRGDVDVDRIHELAAHYGLKVLPCDRVEQLEKERLTKENLVAKAQEIGYVALTSKRIQELEAKADAKEAPMTREAIEQRAASFGLTVMPIQDDHIEGSKYSNVGRDSKEVLIARAHEFNLILLEHDEYQRLCEHKKGEDTDQQRKRLSDFSLNDVVELASRFGLVPIEKKQFEEIKSELSHPTLTKEELVELAPEHNMVCISKVEYDHIKALSKNRTSTKEAEGTKTSADKSYNPSSTSKNALIELQAIAKEHGLFRGPKDISPSVLGSKLNEAHKFVVLPNYYYNDLLNENKMLDLKLKRVENRSSNVKVSPRAPIAQDKSSQGLPQPPLIGSPKVNRQTSRSSLRTIAAGAKKNLVEASAVNAHEDFVKVPKAMSHGSILGVKHSRNPSLVTRNDSIVSSIGRTGSMGAISLATVASLSEPSIIPALTQTVIGEYLYKYYPYLGQFGMNSRHERFFWVHPYTLTLYWSTGNPIMANPSNHKTKCAAILAVDSIVDTNPYPAGLYHKSIIVTSEKKTVKITCPTRQRHNIWYNSLRYLIQRNMEGINLEDIADDPSDTMYSGKIFPLPGENSKSTSQRLSSSRKSMKKLPNPASMPIKRR